MQKRESERESEKNESRNFDDLLKNPFEVFYENAPLELTVFQHALARRTRAHTLIRTKSKYVNIS